MNPGVKPCATVRNAPFNNLQTFTYGILKLETILDKLVDCTNVKSDSQYSSISYFNCK